MSIASKVRTGSLWLAGTRLLTNGLGLVSTLVTARLLAPDDFGVVAIGTTLQLIVASFTELSLAQAIIHSDDPDDRLLNCAFTLNFLRGLILTILFIVTAPLVAAFYGDQRLIWIMIAIALSIVISSLENPKLAVMKRDLVFWQDFALQVISKVAMIVVAIAVALITQNYLALVAAIVGSALARQVASYFFVPYRPRFRLKEYKQLLDFSGWVTLSQIVDALNWKIDPLIVGKFLSPLEVGLVTVSTRLAQIPTQETTNPLSATLFPAFRQIRDQPERLRAASMRAQTLITAIAMPCGLMLAILAKPLIVLALGVKWLPAVPVVQIICAIMSLQTLSNIASPLAMASGRTRMMFRRSLQGLTYRQPLVITALYFDGLRGFLLARMASCIIGIILDMLIVKEITKLSHLQQFLANWRTLAASIVMVAIAFHAWPLLDFGQSISQLSATVASLGILSGTVYLCTLFGLWLVSGKPTGPEIDILDVAKGVLHRGRQLCQLRRA